MVAFELQAADEHAVGHPGRLHGDGGKLEEIWHDSRPAPDRRVIDGAHLGKSLHVALHAAPPTGC